VPHAGRQVIKNNTTGNYTDVSLTLNKDLGDGLSASLSAISTNASKTFYTVNNYYQGKNIAVLGLKYSF
jgi:hypothetical protein